MLPKSLDWVEVVWLDDTTYKQIAMSLEGNENVFWVGCTSSLSASSWIVLDQFKTIYNFQ